jgi:hypothetical protein
MERQPSYSFQSASGVSNDTRSPSTARSLTRPHLLVERSGSRPGS